MGHHHHCDLHAHDHCCEESHHHHDCGCCCHNGASMENAHPDFAHELLELADAAWMELLKDKIKEQIKSSNGAQLDKLAKLVNHANKERWDHKMAKKSVCDSFREKLHEHFTSKK